MRLDSCETYGDQIVGQGSQSNGRLSRQACPRDLFSQLIGQIGVETLSESVHHAVQSQRIGSITQEKSHQPALSIDQAKHFPKGLFDILAGAGSFLVHAATSVALEQSGQPWDKITWKTDVAEAVAIAQKEQKPIFVFFFLKKNVGPVDAPC